MAVISRLFERFVKSEQTGAFLLILGTLVSLVLANSAAGTAYIQFWETDIAGHSISYWINDALMAVFFLLVGLELKRELFSGELSSFKAALMPLTGALGGMLVPALLYIAINRGTPFVQGAGIPMATDIAFALAVLSLLNKRVPAALKVFLTALAVIDDLGAILVIAIFYTQTIQWAYLLAALGLFGILVLFNKLKISSLLFYLPLGIVLWYCMWRSGVHATIAGVLLAFTIPLQSSSGHAAPLELLEHSLSKPVAYVILPLFAIANTAFSIDGSITHLYQETYSLGIATGLVIGKPLGIFGFCFAAVRLGWAQLHKQLRWRHILGAGILGGIGFTMSVFIALLAFDDIVVINNAKLAIMLASCCAALLGYLLLRLGTSGTAKTYK